MMISSKTPPSYKVFIRDLTIAWQIGVFNHEYTQTQPICINVEMDVMAIPDPLSDRYEDIVCYAKISDHIRAMATEGHINLLETLAQKIAMTCLADKRVQMTRVRIEKPAAMPDAKSVGVETSLKQAESA